MITDIVNERMNNPPNDATIGTTILFFLEFSSTLPTTGLIYSNN
jgi:hypothetical protein